MALTAVAGVQGRASETARHVVNRAMQLAVERGVRVSTLHLAQAVLELDTELSRRLVGRRVRSDDLRTGGKVHREEPGTFERTQSTAKRIAASCASTEVSELHLLMAALSDRKSAFSSMVSQLGYDPHALAEELYKNPRTEVARARAQGPSAAQPEPEAPERASRPPQRPILSSPSPVRTGPGRGSSVPAAPTPAQGISVPVMPEPNNGARTAQGRGQSAARSTPPGGVSAGLPQNPRTARPPQGKGGKPERTEHDLDPRVFPALSLCARNLTAEAARGVVDPVVGREREVSRVLDAVARREGRGALVVGPSGVGKSTLVRALARTAGAPTVLSLRHSEIAVLARGAQGAERARALVEELLRVADRVVVALDPIAPWFLSRDVPDELVLELRAALVAGKLPWIGTATPEEARRLGELESWVERAVLRVELEPPTGELLNEMVRAFAPVIATHHGVLAEPPVLQHAAELSERYLGGRSQPDRALNVVDLALARARRAASPVLTREGVAQVVAELGGVPVERVSASDQQCMLELEKFLASRVVGHAHAASRVAAILRRNAVGFRGARPIGTFLFLGPTGVGKTETAKAVAEALFPGGHALTRFDMAEFAEPHAVARLVGAPPGYVGHHDGGQLTEAVRKRPYQLILFDEIEKAHRDVLEALLGVLDEGRMTDGRGRTVDFRNTVLVLTSNLGAEAFDGRARSTTRSIGFGVNTDARAAQQEETRTAEQALERARAALPPELWNRIDEPLVFGALTRAEVSEIARRLLAQSLGRLKREQGVVVEHGEELLELLLDNGGYEPTLGARPMRRAIARLIEAPLAESVLRGELRAGGRAKLEVRDWGVAVVPLRG